MQHSTTTSLAAAIVCLVLVALASLPAVSQTWRRYLVTSRARDEDFQEHYKDEDGVATKETESAFSDLTPRLLLALGSIVGALDSLAMAILATLRIYLRLATQQWLHFATWIFLLSQAVILFTSPKSVRRFELGVYGGFSHIVLIVAIFVENFSLWSIDAIPRPRNLHVTLTVVQVAASLLSLSANVSLPRRPDVLRDGKVVDRQYTTSLISRFTWAWPSPILYFATMNKRLEIEDLPQIDHRTRSEYLRHAFETVGRKDKLWKAIFWSHKHAFIMQWTLQVFTSLTNFLPQIALLYILRTLEARDAGQDTQWQAWAWVIGLGAAIIISSWLEAWLFFVVFCKIGIPVYEQISAVVFGKAMRRKDVKSAGKKRDDMQPASGNILVSKAAGPQDEEMATEEEGVEDVQKSRQSTINLVGVDGKRVADFATFNYLFLGTVLKLIFAFGFLVNLVGWLPLLAGLLVPAVVTPINVFAANRYAKAQDDLMKVRDQKMAVVTEALQGIRQIKFSAFERNWNSKILEIRGGELNTQWRVFIFDTCLISIWILGPVMLAAVTLAVYATLNKQLSASVAFTTVSVFEVIEMTLAIIPEFITEYLDAKISANRIQEYLDSPEKGQVTEPGPTVSFQKATIAWPSDDVDKEEDQFQLRNMTIAFPKHELSVISGKTGSGKSLLLASILGESDILQGTVQVPRPPADRYDAQATRNSWYIEGAIAFVAQIPWIENATIKDNILFGLPDDALRYKKVLQVCALEVDLHMLQDGDLTDIGANGINLSGGQKWRVSFARALYSRASILVLDDIFSAVDSHVGKTLFEEALTGELGRGRTRILATHHVSLCLPRTSYSVLLGDGVVQYAGTVDELRNSGALKTILAHDIEEREKEEEESALGVDDGVGLSKIISSRSNKSRRRSTQGQHEIDRPRRKSTLSKDDAKEVQNPMPKKFTDDEARATGSIKLKLYITYITASGGFGYWTFVMAAFASSIIVYLGRSWWVSVWTRSYQSQSTKTLFASQNVINGLKSEFKAIDIDPNLAYYLGVYIAWSIATCIIGASRYFLVFLASIRASKELFEKLTFTVLRAPLRWLDTMPMGRILNRFTSDFNMIDSRISIDLAFMLHNAMQVLSVILAGLFISAWMIAFAAVLLLASLYYAVRYLAGAREVKRLESNAKSPIFEQFGSALTGIGTIRAFDKADVYVTRMHRKINQHARVAWHLWLFNRWMGFRLNMVGAAFALITAALIVNIKSVDASLAGFALSFSLEIATSIVWMLRQYASVEIDMNAVERVVEYSNIPIESQDGDSPPAAWPTQGRLELSDLVVGYAPELGPVLKGLSFSVKSNQRVGVVGRTGAGKSSLTLAIFRFLEAREGIVLIDGIDISKIKLEALRSRLAIIPQDPVLFSGTVRSNLDAFDEHGDAELRDALERVHLAPRGSTGATSAAASGTATPTIDPNSNKNIFRSLNSRVSEGGLNLSQGQRQLLCLARAIVSRPKIMVLDEATSAVDMETDALIQRSIREEFQDSTLLVIAHRLSTIADFDKILVMGDGRVLEYDEPRLLMEKEGGEFRRMVEESGERDLLEEVITGVRRPG